MVEQNNNGNTTTTTRIRRSKWQMIASRKLPYSIQVAGDGPFVVLSRCTGQQIRRWRYWLHDSDIAATACRAALDKAGCHSECKGKHEHAQWQLMPWDSPPRQRFGTHKAQAY